MIATIKFGRMGGPIVDGLDAIMGALRSGHLAGVGLDVLPDEPPQAHPLIDARRSVEPWGRGRLTVNPHTGYYSRRAWKEMRFKAAEPAAMYLRTAERRTETRAAQN